jgi:ribosomal protein L11 methylase PrmA
VFFRDRALLREVMPSYEPHYRKLIDSCLYERLVADGLLVEHEEVDVEQALSAAACRVLRPKPIPLVTYPYEWCFSELKEAALLTLRLEEMALQFGMTLKDASAYNVQFCGARPLMIDTLSFEIYEPGSAWTPYLQFCRHFLAPLALMSCCDPRAGQLLRGHTDGLPLDLACSLLPIRARLRPGLLLHLYLHARAERVSASHEPVQKHAMSMQSRLGLIDGLRRTVTSLTWRSRTLWSEYGEHDTYSEDGARHKRQIVTEYLARAQPRQVWDLGANVGSYSRIASEQGIPTFAWDADAGCVERAYREAVDRKDDNLLPLVMDLTNPSPALGWAHAERQSLRERCAADLVMALALIHHLTIAAGIPLANVAAFFAELAPWSIVEFVDRDDPKAAAMLATRGEVRPYTRTAFEEAFRKHFDVVETAAIRDTRRQMYLMKRRG